MSTVTTAWEHLRTPESREVERKLGATFNHVDAYRYNSASLRVRIVDQRFKGMTNEMRDDLVEQELSMLDPNTQRDIMNLILLYPEEPKDSFRAWLNNEEFEKPTKSML